MWPNEPYAQPHVTHLLEETLLRLLLLIIVCSMAFMVQPHMQYISQEELLADYKRPRRQAFVSLWALGCIVLIVPLLIFALPWLLTKNYMETTEAILAWSLAMTITAFITECLKLSVGRPRPDFFYRCFPDGIMAQSCTGNWRDIMEGRKSFPSGHSSLSFCSLTFLSLWMCGKWRVSFDNPKIAIMVTCCLLPLVAATTIAVSRVIDNRHHCGDVLIGSFIGMVTSYFCYAYYYQPIDDDYVPFVSTQLNPTIESSSQRICSVVELSGKNI